MSERRGRKQKQCEPSKQKSRLSLAVCGQARLSGVACWVARLPSLRQVASTEQSSNRPRRTQRELCSERRQTETVTPLTVIRRNIATSAIKSCNLMKIWDFSKSSLCRELRRRYLANNALLAASIQLPFLLSRSPDSAACRHESIQNRVVLHDRPILD